jgi:uncharacterized protein YbjT (DUF2867 family)
MKVVVFGGTGAMGQPQVRALVKAGHEAIVSTRDPDHLVEIFGAGVSARAADFADRASI